MLLLGGASGLEVIEALLEELGSGVVELTWAVFVMAVKKRLAFASTLTTRVIGLLVAPDATGVRSVQVSTPPVGPAQFQPGATTRANVVPDGMASVIVGVASFGPWLVAVIV